MGVSSFEARSADVGSQPACLLFLAKRLVLVDDDALFHEDSETTFVQFGRHAADLVLFPLLQGDFEEVFSHLLQIVALQVVDDRNVVDVAPVHGDELVSCIWVLFFELDCQLALLVWIFDQFGVLSRNFVIWNIFHLDRALALHRGLLLDQLSLGLTPRWVRLHDQQQ